MHTSIQTVSFIGSGNVATHLANAFIVAGLKVVEIISENVSHANELANTINAAVPASIADLQKVDLICIAVKDDAIGDVIQQLTPGHQALVHTSGSVDMKILKGKADHVGVLYPVMSFKKSESVIWNELPICIEAGNDAFTSRLFELAGKLSKQVSYLNSTQRIQLHIAAVIVNNFSNYLYAVSHEMLLKQHLPFSLLLPLIKQTSDRLTQQDPWRLQTGPAFRKDLAVIERHLKLLEGNPDARELYSFISNQIIKKAPH